MGIFSIEILLVGIAAASLLSVGLVARNLHVRAQSRDRELEQLKAQVLEWNRRLEERVAERTKTLEGLHNQLQETYLETVTALIEAVSAKDTHLFGHAHNVATYAKVIAKEMAFPKERLHRLAQGCELHDLGKIAIPDAILMKPGPLTPEEYEIVKQHPRWGARILEPLTFMKDITDMVLQEHERWDGSGYPQGLKGEQIRLEARIISVADALDAMTAERPYRKRIPLPEAAEEIKRNAGTQFDPKVVEHALKAIREGKLTVVNHRHPVTLLKTKGV